MEQTDPAAPYREKLERDETLTIEDARALLDLQVAKNGRDYIYPRVGGGGGGGSGSCVNWTMDPTGRPVPSCIVGHVFADLGLLGDITQSSTAFGAAHDAGDVFDDPALSLLSRAQAYQDKGIAWGDAVERAHAEVLNEIENGQLARSDEDW